MGGLREKRQERAEHTMKEETTQQGKAYERVITYIKSEILKGEK